MPEPLPGSRPRGAIGNGLLCGRVDFFRREQHDDLALTGKIAWAHLKESPDYYARLDKLEAEAAAYWASRR